MPNKVPLDLPEDEIRHRCEEIQATWTEAVRNLRRRGNYPTEPGRDIRADSYTVPVVNERELLAR